VILQAAWKNFCRQGLRAILNVLVAALTLVVAVFMVSLVNGFQDQSSKNLKKTDVAGGHYRLADFDILSPTEWEDFAFVTPPELKKMSSDEKAEVLVQQGQLFPQNRFIPAQIRGISLEQSLLELPLDSLNSYKGDSIPAIIGTKMAKKSNLKKGDFVVLKWRDKYGAVDAREIEIIETVRFVNPRLNDGVVWLGLKTLRNMTRRESESSWVTVKSHQGEVKGLSFLVPEVLMKDVIELAKHDRRNSMIMWIILMILCCISVFNSQMLNAFKRQKEAGTLLALGMTPGQLTKMFVLEGSFTAVGAVILAFFLGIPFFSWFQTVGLDISHLKDSTIPITENIILVFDLKQIINCLLTATLMIVFASWLPARKISRIDPSRALVGKAF
jgi:putative ABC transport system permease protein